MTGSPYWHVKITEPKGPQDLWLRNSYFMTSDAFPGIRRRAQIIDSRVVEVTPIQNAVNSMHSKSEELKEIIIKCVVNPSFLFALSSLTLGVHFQVCHVAR